MEDIKQRNVAVLDCNGISVVRSRVGATWVEWGQLKVMKPLLRLDSF